MTTRSPVPDSIRASCRLRPHEVVFYDGLCALARLTGAWDPPPRAASDLEEMNVLDKAFWLYKSGLPVRRAVRGSGLEAYFARPKPERLLPADFDVGAELRLSAVGDLMPHPYLEGSAESLYRDVEAAIFDADVAMGNLECVVAPRPDDLVIEMTRGPVVGLEPAAFDVIANAARRPYDFLATASNHSLDLGERGVASTVAELRRLGVAFHGVNERDEDAARATILERGGLRLGVVAHTFGLNGHRPPEHRPRLVNRTRVNYPERQVELDALEAQLRHAAQEGVDFTIVQLHWGWEFEYYPRPEQLEVAHRIAELGADLIVGHHPHVLQPMELYRTRRDPDRLVPIYYSLGNLTVPFATPFLARSGIARLTLARGARPGARTYVREATTIEVEQRADDATRTLELRRVSAG